MRGFGDLWNQYHDGYTGNKRYDVAVTIDGRLIPIESIIKKSWSGGMTLTDFDIGIAPAQRFTVAFYADNFSTAQNQTVVVRIRVVGDMGETPYYSFGTYYTDKVTRDGNKYTCECADGMKFLDKTGYDFNGRDMQYAVSLIANVAGCYFNTDGITGYIPDTDLTKYSLREILGFIASLNGGNFIIDFENTLKLIRLKTTNPIATINTDNAVKTRKIEETKELSGIAVQVDDETEHSAGGGENVLSFFNPLAEQAAVYNLFQQLSDYDYTPCEVVSAYVNPALEIGDTVLVRGKITQIWNWNISTGMTISFEAPSNFDRYDKYEFKGTLKRELERIEKSTETVVETLIENVIENVVENTVLVSTNAQILNCWVRNLTVEYYESNFDAIDVRSFAPFDNHRNFIRIYGQYIWLYSAELSGSETEDFKTPDGDQIYYTSIGDEPQAYKYFTLTDPITVQKNTDDMTEGEKDTIREMFRVKVRKTLNLMPRLQIGFDESHPDMIPKVIWGQGDGVTEKSGKGYIFKEAEGLVIEYYSRGDEEARYIKLVDSGIEIYPSAIGGGASHMILDRLPTSNDDIPEGEIVLVRSTEPFVFES